MAEPVLSIRGLRVTLHRDGRPIRALDGIDLDLAAGEIVALVGESGSGKSTLGLAVQGLLAAEAAPRIEGSIRLEGRELLELRPAAARHLRAGAVRGVFQDALGALNPTMTVGAQMAEVVSDRAAARSWLARVELPDPDAALRAWPHQLSGGQQQRVLIAMAMAAQPRVLIADEPTTALDVTVQAQILTLIRDLARAQRTGVVFVTHDLAVAANLAERIAVLYAGRLAEVGPTEELIKRPAHAYTAALLSARFDLTADPKRPLPTLPGEPPVPGAAPGCAFAPRCPLAVRECDAGLPPIRPAPGHRGRTACLRAKDVRPLRQGDDAHWPSPEVSDTPVLTLDRVSKHYRTHGGLFTARRFVAAVCDVTLSVPAGGSLAIVGESGSGKSTLLRLCAGLLLPDAGRVEVCGSGRLQMIHQDATASFTPWLTIGEQIAERLHTLRLSRADRAARVEAALASVGLPGAATALPGELSGGQCQRAAVARAIVVPPDLLLCDEPVSAMDVSLAAQALNLLGQLRRDLSMALVFVTHDIAAARLIGERIAVMCDGELVEEGPAEALVTRPSHPYTRALIEAMPVLDARGTE